MSSDKDKRRQHEPLLHAGPIGGCADCLEHFMGPDLTADQILLYPSCCGFQPFIQRPSITVIVSQVALTMTQLNFNKE